MASEQRAVMRYLLKLQAERLAEAANHSLKQSASPTSRTHWSRCSLALLSAVHSQAHCSTFLQLPSLTVSCWRAMADKPLPFFSN